jgi:pyridoxal phosphate enzyme (YggS family)
MIANALSAVRERITHAARAAGRSPASVRLIAVSKTKPASYIREAYAAGQRDFGENYAQELAEKAHDLADLPDLRWHFIGHLQSNKAKLIAPIAHVLHSVDSASLVRELERRLGSEHRPPLEVLVEVNVGGEAQKHGILPEALPSLLDLLDHSTNLRLRGLMTIPPNDPELARRAFHDLAALRERHGGVTRLPELSMGMSQDLDDAIACGATMVRVGTAIFGARESGRSA